MPRYFFNIYDGSGFIDDQGVVLADLAAARKEALQVAGESLAEAGVTDGVVHEWKMEVTDEAGLILFRLDFSMSSSSSVAYLPISGGLKYPLL